MVNPRRVAATLLASSNRWDHGPRHESLEMSAARPGEYGKADPAVSAAGDRVENRGMHERLGEPLELDPLVVPHHRIGNVQCRDQVGIGPDLRVRAEGRRRPSEPERKEDRVTEAMDHQGQL